MIYYDPTESRKGTRLYESIVNIGRSLIGLEALTGADLLISPFQTPLPARCDTPIGMKMIQRHLQSGMLVQRKSGMDMLSSIPHLKTVLCKMRQHSEQCWLMVCGEYYARESEFVAVGNRATEWKWSSFKGALDSWQRLGGHTHEEPTDYHGGLWLKHCDEKIEEWNARNEVLVLPESAPKLSGGMFYPRPWETALSTFPGCGSETAKLIGETKGTLYESLCWMSDVSAIDIPGIGKTRKQEWAKWLGLPDSVAIVPSKSHFPEFRLSDVEELAP